MASLYGPASRTTGWPAPSLDSTGFEPLTFQSRGGTFTTPPMGTPGIGVVMTTAREFRVFTPDFWLALFLRLRSCLSGLASGTARRAQRIGFRSFHSLTSFGTCHLFVSCQFVCGLVFLVGCFITLHAGSVDLILNIFRQLAIRWACTFLPSHCHLHPSLCMSIPRNHGF